MNNDTPTGDAGKLDFFSISGSTILPDTLSEMLKQEQIRPADLPVIDPAKFEQLAADLRAAQAKFVASEKVYRLVQGAMAEATKALTGAQQDLRSYVASCAGSAITRFEA